MVETKEVWTTGRRKDAKARVKLTAGNGKITVNGATLEEYFPRETDRILIMQPLEAANMLNKFNIFVNLTGGGKTGQAGALRLGIARAMASIDESVRSLLRKEGFLRRDPRMKERKKYGQKGARSKFQWTKR